MTLTTDERDALIVYRIQKSNLSMVQAIDVAKLEHWSLVANRLYYAVYYMATALLLKKGLKAQTHSGVMHLLGLHFVKTGLLGSNEGRLFTRLFEMRQSGDYDDLFDLTSEEVEPYIDKAKAMIAKMEVLLSEIK